MEILIGHAKTGNEGLKKRRRKSIRGEEEEEERGGEKGLAGDGKKEREEDKGRKWKR